MSDVAPRSDRIHVLLQLICFKTLSWFKTSSFIIIFFSRYVGGRRIGSWKGGESLHLVGALHFRGRGGSAGGCGARGPGTYTAIFYLPILYQHAENKHKVFLCLFFVCLVLSLSLLQVNVGRDSSEDSTKTCLMAAVQVF